MPIEIIEELGAKNEGWELKEGWIDSARKKRELEAIPKRGPISPRADKRCFCREAIEELLDALNYAQWAREKGEINRQKWKWLDSDLRRAITIIELVCHSKWSWKLEGCDDGNNLFNG